MRISNINCRSCVDNLMPFKGSNLSGIKSSIYVVYSYGWYPLWANINGTWYGHNSRYSVTTTKQRSQSRPSGDITMLKGVDDLRAML